MPLKFQDATTLKTDYPTFAIPTSKKDPTFLGKGSYGLVIKAQHKDGQFHAVKALTKLKTTDRKRLLKEVKMNNKASKFATAKIYGMYEDNNYFYIASEILTGGDLNEFDKSYHRDNYHWKTIPLDDIKVIFRRLFQILDSLHGQGIVHQDIKGENCMFKVKDDLLSVVFIDFGLADQYGVNPRKISGSRGTMLFMAPEVADNYLKIKNNKKSDPVTERADIWSMGVMLWRLLQHGPFVDRYPFYHHDDREAILKKIIKGECTDPDRGDSVALDFLKACLTVDPKKRPSARKLLLHPWLYQDIEERKEDYKRLLKMGLAVKGATPRSLEEKMVEYEKDLVECENENVLTEANKPVEDFPKLTLKKWKKKRDPCPSKLTWDPAQLAKLALIEELDDDSDSEADELITFEHRPDLKKSKKEPRSNNKSSPPGVAKSRKREDREEKPKKQNSKKKSSTSGVVQSPMKDGLKEKSKKDKKSSSSQVVETPKRKAPKMSSLSVEDVGASRDRSVSVRGGKPNSTKSKSGSTESSKKKVASSLSVSVGISRSRSVSVRAKN